MKCIANIRISMNDELSNLPDLRYMPRKYRRGPSWLARIKTRERQYVRNFRFLR